MKKISRTTTLALVLGLVIVVVGSLFLFRHNLQRVWAAAQPHQQNFAQMAFEDPLEVPKTIKAQEPYEFAFWVGSHWDDQREYAYTVYLQNGGERTEVASGTVVLQPNQRTDVRLSVFAPEVAERQQIVVELPALKQSIHFWADGTKS